MWRFMINSVYHKYWYIIYKLKKSNWPTHKHCRLLHRHVTLFREYSCYIKGQEKGTTASDDASIAWRVQDTGRNCRQISKPFRCIQHSGGRRFVISERCQSTWTTIFTLIPQAGEEEKVLYISLHWLCSLKNSFTFRPNFLFLCLYTRIRGISFS